MKRALLLFLLLFTASVHAEWQLVAPGVEYQHITKGHLDVHVARVDLRNAKLRVIASEESDHGLTVSEFAKKRGAIIAINADYFGGGGGGGGVWWGCWGTWTKGQK